MKFHLLVYCVAAAALWRLWSSPREQVWWIVCIALILSVWSNRAVHAGVKVALRDLGYSDPSKVSNPTQEAMQSPDGPAIKFWMRAAVVINVATLIISVMALLFA